MKSLKDSNFYSVLYYNSVIWLTPNLKSDLKHNLELTTVSDIHFNVLLKLKVIYLNFLRV